MCFDFVSKCTGFLNQIKKETVSLKVEKDTLQELVKIKKNILGKTILIGIISIVIGLIVLINNNRFMQFAPEHDETIFHENFSEHLNATIGLKDISNAERFHRWVAGVRMVAEKPWTGFGANSFYNNYQPYTAAAFKTWVSNNPEHSTVHNYYLLVALEQGLPALILFGGFYIYLLFLY